MSRQYRPDGALAEPEQGEEIQLIGADGAPDGRCTKVRRVVSADYREEIFEVLDNFNQTRFITALTASSWIEVEIE